MLATFQALWAHIPQGASVQELTENLREVVAMLLEDGVPLQKTIRTYRRS
jgi:hypothetical protein